MPKLRYTITAVLEVDAEYPEEIQDCLENIRESGEILDLKVEVIEDNDKSGGTPPWPGCDSQMDEGDLNAF
jgi:hypothetical protein